MNKLTKRKHKNNHIKRSNKSNRRTISKRKKVGFMRGYKVICHCR